MKPRRTTLNSRLLTSIAQAGAGLSLFMAAAGFAPAASAATSTTCGAATGQGVNGPADYSTYCWIDFSGYNNTTATGAAGQSFVVTLPGGSTLSFTLKVSGPALKGATVPTWTGAAMGQSAFLSIPGSPALYQTTGAGTTSVTMSNIVLTVGSGTVPYAIVAADAESTNNGESLSFTTNGNAWTLLASMAYNGTPSSFPTLTPATSPYGATVTETGVAGNVGAYAFATQGSPTTISASLTGTGLQGMALAVKFHATDFSITKSHTGNFSTGGTGSYTLTVTNNGPDQYTPADTVTVTDTLPAGLTYASASGSGWTCGAAGQVVTCTASNVTVNSGSSLPAITLNVNVGTPATNSVTNTATVSESPNLDFNSANNTATDVTTILYSTDVQITKTNASSFTAGTPGAYTLTVMNNGPLGANGTTSVSDTLPSTETYISASGTGWTCGAVSQVVTCTSTTTMASGASLPAITLNVQVAASAPSSVANTATVSNSLVNDTNNANNSSTDNSTVTEPNYSTSTKAVSTTSTTSGSTITYTITVTDTSGQVGNNIEVTDTLDPDLSGLSVTTLPPGATNSSTGTQLDITGIDIAANGTATIVFTALVTGSPGDVIQNTATIVGGPTNATPTAPPVSVTGSTNGSKNLYLLTAGETATTGSMWRIQGAVATGASQSIAGNGSVTWTLQYKMAKATTLSGPVVANLYFTRGTGGGGNRAMKVALSNGTTTLTSASTNCNPAGGATPTLCPITISAAGTIALAVGNQLTLTVTSNSIFNANIALFPEFSAATQSYVSFNVNPAINVDSIAFYNTAYNSVSTQSVWEANANIYIRTQISDPFGCADIGIGTTSTPVGLTVTDANSATQVNGVNLAGTASFIKTTCATPTAPNAYAATMVYEYPLMICLPTVAGTCTIPNSNGYWSATVVAKEGNEETVSNTGSDSFLVGVPSILIVKSVSITADPINGATKPRAIPGGTALYNIIVSNTGNGAANGLFVQDPIPTNSSFVVGSLTWTDGSTTSGLSPPTYSYDNSTGANICKGTFTYTPTAGANGTDPNVTCVKATFTGGTMSGQTGSSAPSFTLNFNTKVN